MLPFKGNLWCKDGNFVKSHCRAHELYHSSLEREKKSENGKTKLQESLEREV